MQNHPENQELFQLLEKVDADLTQEARMKGCPLRGGKLHRSEIDRKPQGGPQWVAEQQPDAGPMPCYEPLLRFMKRYALFKRA